MLHDIPLTSIDSVLINGTYRNRYTYNSSVKVIEGIDAVEQSGIAGYAELFMVGPCVCSWSWQFDCYWENAQKLYGYNSCFGIGIEETKHGAASPIIFPNPATDLIRIQGLERDVPYAFFNELGEVIKRGKTQGLRIEINEIKNGMYFLVLNNKYPFKIILQR